MQIEWLLARIAEALETGELWMLDRKAIERAWEAQEA